MHKTDFVILMESYNVFLKRDVHRACQNIFPVITVKNEETTGRNAEGIDNCCLLFKQGHFLAQGHTVYSQQIGGMYLIALGKGQRFVDHQCFHLGQQLMIGP
jgi:hypothetical protein